MSKRYTGIVLLCPLLFSCGGGDQSVLTDISPNSGASPSPSTPPPTTSSPPGGNSTAQPAISILSAIRAKDGANNVRYLGSVTNTGNASANFVDVTCTSRDSSVALGANSSFIVGTVVKLTNTGSITNTALNPGDIGYFEILTSRSDASVATFTCATSHDIFPSGLPEAGMENLGIPAVTSDSQGSVRINGRARNKGSKGLVFGEVHAIILDRASRILDISSSFVDGQTVILTATGSTTDTALNVAATGDYEINSNAPYSNYGSTIYKFDWSDSTISNGRASKLTSVLPEERILTPLERSEERYMQIEELRKLQ